VIESEDQTTEETTEAPEEPAVEAEAPVEETPAAEAEAPAEEAAPAPEAEAPAEEEAPAAEPEAPAAAAPAPPAEPQEVLSPKERRQRKRGTAGEARPQRTLEERLAERDADRKRLAAHRRTRRQREREQRTATASEREASVATEREPGRKRTRQGIVVSDKADKTITVKIDVARPHRVYKKIVRSSATLHAHDERNEAHIGDTVRIIESRPLSRTKRWRLVEVVERAR
jgi:small subunit ribosomal protein S17